MSALDRPMRVKHAAVGGFGQRYADIRPSDVLAALDDEQRAELTRIGASAIGYTAESYHEAMRDARAIVDAICGERPT